jgi:hypothetical protein
MLIDGIGQQKSEIKRLRKYSGDPPTINAEIIPISS